MCFVQIDRAGIIHFRIDPLRSEELFKTCMYGVTAMGRVISPNLLNFGWVDYGKKIEKDHFC